jgi:hypothetical protein
VAVNSERVTESAVVPPIGAARRFDRGAWLTLAAAAVLLLWPLALSILFAGTPSDGWASYTAEGFFDGQFVMDYSLTGQPSPLRTDDVIVAIDGQPLVKGQLPPLPTPLVAGETVRYTVERAGQTFKADIPLVQIGLRAYGAIWLHNPLKSLATLVTLIIAAAVFFLRPQLPAARFMLIAFMYLAGNAILEIVGNPFVYALPPVAIFLASFYQTGYAWAYYASLILLVLVFPVTLLPMRRFPRALPALLYVVPFVMMGLSTPWYPTTTQSDWQLLVGGVTFVSYATLTAVVTIGVILYNLRTVKDPIVLAQVRWMVFGLGIGVAVTNLLGLIPRLQPWSYLTALALPIALAIGILRYRLFDIDVIIRRTTSYAILTGILLLVYFGSIVVLQRLLSPITGDSQAAVVLSTLLIAALFLPLRRRVQDAIDRRFFRQKYDAEQVMAQFAATVRDETDLDALTAELVRVIQETMQPEFVSVWLKEPDKQ